MDNDAAVRAAKEQLWSHQLRLQAAVGHLQRRTALPSKATACGCCKRRCERCGSGYATENERVMKRRRLDVLRGELAGVQRRRAEGRYGVCLGGDRLAMTRHHLDDAGLTERQWRRAWEERRAWFGCVGNAGVLGGNPCLSLRQDDPDRPGECFLTVSVPKPVQARFGCGSRIPLTHPVPLHHRRELECWHPARPRGRSRATAPAHELPAAPRRPSRRPPHRIPVGADPVRRATGRAERRT